MTSPILPKTYDPRAIESSWYDQWLSSGHFACDPKSDKSPYTIMMPPPNVTGNLHMGHALTFTLQDLLIRYYRMAGCDTLWQPGIDHAGIATQMVVERQLAAQNISRRDLGRDAFIDKVWAWKAESWAWKAWTWTEMFTWMWGWTSTWNRTHQHIHTRTWSQNRH